jgi:uncharacterized membrane protein
MIRIYIILGLIAVCGVLFFIARAQSKRAKKAEAEAARLHDAFWEMTRKAQALQAAQQQNIQVMEAANAERQELTATADSALVNRANSLFGMRDKQGSNNGKN